jgi:hypothetical protein
VPNGIVGGKKLLTEENGLLKVGKCRPDFVHFFERHDKVSERRCASWMRRGPKIKCFTSEGYRLLEVSQGFYAQITDPKCNAKSVE